LVKFEEIPFSSTVITTRWSQTLIMYQYICKCQGLLTKKKKGKFIQNT
jgi:hypothetical protein